LGALRALGRIMVLAIVYPILGMTAIFLLAMEGGQTLRYLRRVQALARIWHGISCKVLNIHIKRFGLSRLPSGGALVVANHAGTPDIFVLGSCVDLFFVSKAEVANWPLVGWLTRLGGTLYVVREKRMQVHEVISKIAERLDMGFSALLFPEGTAGAEETTLPFKTAHFESALRSGKPVVPVSIIYHDGGSPSVACWVDKTFGEHIWGLLTLSKLEVSVKIHPPLIAEKERRVLARKSREQVDAGMIELRKRYELERTRE
jgi:1-acyl-sn-glycerol-3-phosphate acyltransferase